MARRFDIFFGMKKKVKKMRQVVDHTNDESNERFCYKALNYADELAVLLAGKRKRAAETCRMAKKVNDEMSKRMDTGVRPNPLLMRIHGKSTSRANDQPPPRPAVPSDTIYTSTVPLTGEECERRELVLVAYLPPAV